MPIVNERPLDGTPLEVIVATDVSELPASLQQSVTNQLQLHENMSITTAALDEQLARVKEIDSHIQVQRLIRNDLTVSVRLTIEAKTLLGTVRVGGAVQAANLLRKVEPVYPALAMQARVQGTVRFTVRIGKDGVVNNIQLVSGHPLLIPAATEALKQWVYNPTLLNGNPVEVITQVDINFILPAAN